MKASLTLRYLFILAIGAVLFLPFLGQVHLFDWDEINFAECAREMIVSKDYLRMQIDFQPFYEKPPLFIWMQVLTMKLFGINEYAARFPDALCGMATLVTLYHVGRKVATERVGQWWVILYACTWLPHFYFKTAIIDPVFNYFIFLAFVQVHLLRFSGGRGLHAALAGFFLGLAVLTKGPVALIVAGLAYGVYWLLQRGKTGIRPAKLVMVALVCLLVTFSWFGVEVAAHGWTFLKEFIVYQAGLFSQNIADHAEPWYYHPIVLLIGCFPVSALLFQFYRPRPSIPDAANTADFTRWMWILFWVVLILFSIVKTKIVHYSSLCYFPMTYLAALQVSRLLQSGGVKKSVRVVMLVVGSLLALAITALPLVGIFKEKLIPFIQDENAVGNLQAPVSWSLAECLWGLLYLALIWVTVLSMRRRFRTVMLALCLGQLLLLQVTVLHFTPKVEAYTQRAAIQFFKRHAGQDIYLQPLGYKSYAHLFYGAVRPKTDTMAYGENWLVSGPVDKPTYFCCKLSAAKNYRGLPQLEELGEQAGFVFFRRR